MVKIEQYKEWLLNEFESRSDEWSFGAFENRLSEIRKGASYHDAKTVIIEAHDAGLWPNTVNKYILTNYKVFGNVSGELTQILNDVYASLSSEEKIFWKPKNNEEES